MKLTYAFCREKFPWCLLERGRTCERQASDCLSYLMCLVEGGGFQIMEVWWAGSGYSQDFMRDFLPVTHNYGREVNKQNDAFIEWLWLKSNQLTLQILYVQCHSSYVEIVPDEYCFKAFYYYENAFILVRSKFNYRLKTRGIIKHTDNIVPVLNFSSVFRILSNWMKNQFRWCYKLRSFAHRKISLYHKGVVVFILLSILVLI